MFITCQINRGEISKPESGLEGLLLKYVSVHTHVSVHNEFGMQTL